MATKIEWTDKTWNPTVGCTPISAGCKHCYARRDHDKRHKAKLAGKNLPPQYAKPFSEVQLVPQRLAMPLHWRKPRRVFVNSVSDLFHPDVPFYFIDEVFATMSLCSQHTFQVLTKRPGRMREYVERLVGRIHAGRCPWRWMPKHIWLGTSVSTQEDADRNIPPLLQCPAAVRFVSIEPMLESVDLHIASDFSTIGHGPSWLLPIASGAGGLTPTIDWVIIGCESGPKRRPSKQDGVRELVEQCRKASVSVFVKQLDIDDRVSKNMAEWPEDLRVQEYPRAAEAAEN